MAVLDTARQTAAITEYLPVCLSSLRADTLTRFDVFVQLGPNQPLVLYCERNIRFTEEARLRLIESRVEEVYVHSSQRHEYSRYLEQHLAEILQDDRIPPADKSEVLYASAYGVIEDLLVSGKTVDAVRRAKEVIRCTVDALASDKVQLTHFLDVISFDYHIYTHSVNVATYSVALAQQVGYSDAATLRELAYGAVFHDVGKRRIDPSILTSKHKLTSEQWEIVMCHPRWGYDLLRDTGVLGEVALDIVLHHHEKLHGGGYPDNLQGKQISPFVRIVTIADVFDAQTTARTFQGARSSFEALTVMRREMAQDLDPELFRAFVKLMGNPGSAAQ
ncbi:MAG TPA: HD domain-containing protein [Candidatus Hydrogenedentes bacterium]|nr:HD domain-containing protein [Candidatus Hydrogenedentota bacterium]HPG67294.1 HD domain-containing protein [Candidatus Hydrogenedentota bacterium]